MTTPITWHKIIPLKIYNLIMPLLITDRVPHKSEYILYCICVRTRTISISKEKRKISESVLWKKASIPTLMSYKAKIQHKKTHGQMFAYKIIADQVATVIQFVWFTGLRAKLNHSRNSWANKRTHILWTCKSSFLYRLGITSHHKWTCHKF